MWRPNTKGTLRKSWALSDGRPASRHTGVLYGCHSSCERSKTYLPSGSKVRNAIHMYLSSSGHRHEAEVPSRKRRCTVTSILELCAVVLTLDFSLLLSVPDQVDQTCTRI